jgi:Mg2+/Co2+ transporter CorB
MDNLPLDIPLSWLAIALFVLLLLSAFFSSSETSMMSLNRYKLKHLAKTNKQARLANKLLSRPDRLLGAILIGNTFAAIFASAIATMLGAHLWGDLGVILATISLTIVLLIFSEILPKTLGALKPEAIALPSTIPLQFLLWLLFPFIWLANGVANAILRWFGVKVQKNHDSLSLEELRIAVADTSSLIPERYQNMLSSILDLEKMTVNDIMIPRTEVIGIDLANESTSIVEQLSNIHHTLLPVFKDDLENVEGILHMRDIARLVTKTKFEIKNIRALMQKPYFIPAGTSLYQQLINFQRNKSRLGLVVNEYGNLLGLVTLEDILEEIVGEFTTDVTAMNCEIYPQEDGGFIIDGSINIRVLNRSMGWELPLAHAKTLSGLIIERLEAIPEPDTCLLLNNYPVEILQVQDNMVKTAKIFPRLPERNC